MKKIIFLLVAFFALSHVQAQDFDQTERKGFVIIAAGKNYDAMKVLAQKVAQKLNYKLDYRDMLENATIGLSMSPKDCDGAGYEFPMYYPRGYDNGNYVSIEYTNGFEGFTPNYYIIIVSNHSKGSPELSKALAFVKTHYKTAYIKYTDVYMGCMH